MKTVSTDLATHFGADCTTLAYIFKAKRTDGTVYGFTSFDQDIVFDMADGDGSVTYVAFTGTTVTATATKDDLSVDNQDVSGFLDSEAISEQDIRAGLWNNAALKIAIVNWNDLTQGCLKMRAGNTGQIKLKNGLFISEVRGLNQKLTTQIVGLYGPLCRAELGSTADGFDKESTWLCGIDISTYRQTGSVDTSADAMHISPSGGLKMIGSATPTADAPDGWFDDGILTFTSGPMDGFTIEVKSYVSGVLELFLPMPFQPANSDTFTIEPGCNKTIDDCHGKFNNIVNHRGEPFIPGVYVTQNYPNAK